MPDISALASKYVETLDTLSREVSNKNVKSLVPFLPFLLHIKGNPYTLDDYFMMKPFFDLTMSRATIIKSGRQVSKTTIITAKACLYAALTPHITILFIAPRYEQIRNISHNYVRAFLTESPLGWATLADNDSQSVLQRNLKNGSMLRFSFAFLSVDRVRSISSDIVMLDEFQDINEDFIPVIEETTAASKHFDMSFYTGTPKTFDNILQKYWNESSQGEWVTPCQHCNHDNIASVEYDLLKMINPEYLACAKCGKELNPRLGKWVHRFPNKLNDFPGYHIPQPIMPFHYEPNPITKTRIKWRKIVLAMEKWPKAKFYNEKLGESCDERASLIALNDLITNSSLRHDNKIKSALEIALQYPLRIMGVDWGGHGVAQTSFTAITIICPNMTSDRIDVIFLGRLPYEMDELTEIQYILNYYTQFRCHILAHDYAGAGGIRETILKQKGLKPNELFPANYMSLTAAPIVTYRPPTTIENRHMYVVDKTRSLLLLCHMIKQNQIKFPQFESWKKYADDFLSLVEDQQELRHRSNVRIITKKSGRSDDIVHALNYACLAYWHSQQKFPQFASLLTPIDKEVEDYLEGRASETEYENLEEAESDATNSV